MPFIKSGDHVEYTCKRYLKGGKILENSDESGPQLVKAGSVFINAPIRQIVSDALVNMAPSQKKTLEVPPERLWGLHNDGLVFEFPIEESPENLKPGETLTIQLQEGGDMEGKVTKIENDVVTVDANHPFAGQNLYLEIAVLSIH